MFLYTVPQPPPGRPAFLDAFHRILWELKVAVAFGTASGMMAAMPYALPPVLANLICGRLERLRRRFLSLADLARAGTLTPLRARAARKGTATGKPRPLDICPRRAGWLSRMLPVRMGQIGPVVERSRQELVKLLADEADFRALVASDPRFGRLLRPVFQMISPFPLPDYLRLPTRTRTPRVKRDPAAPRRRAADPSRLDGPVGDWLVREGHVRPPRRTAPPPTAPAAPPPVCGTATDWTPSHLTRAPRRLPSGRVVDRRFFLREL